MTRLRIFHCVFYALVMLTPYAGNSQAGNSRDFAGNWVLRLGSRVLLVVRLEPAPGNPGHYSGTLERPERLSVGQAPLFSGIEGPAVRYPIVRTGLAANCLNLTAQNPASKTDEDDFRLCIEAGGRASLKMDAPGFDSWPLTREAAPGAVATDWDPARAYTLDDSDISSAEMARIFAADQKDREPAAGKIDWAVVDKADAARRGETRQLLAEGKLHTGEDFDRAAFIFQHGGSPDDYLLAHTLALVAVTRGWPAAIWIASATLDRYLHSIHQPQIFGTQFFFNGNEPTTQEPYNRDLVSDALRRYLGVPSQAAQEERRKQYDAERKQRE